MNAVTAYQLPTAAAQVSSGFYSWNDLPNIMADDGSFTYGAYVGAVTHSWKTIQLLKAGVAAGSNKGTPLVAVDYTSPDTFGGSSDLWGTTLTRADVMDPDFGIQIEVGREDTGASVSYIIKATDFNFSLPEDAVITGVEFTIDYQGFAGGGGTTGIQIDYVALRIYYTYDPVAETEGIGRGVVYTTLMQDRQEPQKQFRYLVYDSDRNFVGDITRRVKSQPTFKQDINNLHSSMVIGLAQNEQSTDPTVDLLITEDGEQILTEDGEDLMIDLAAEVGLGAGTTIEVNNEVEVIAFYGQLEELLTEDGEVMLTEDDEIIMVQDGKPEGDKIFTGYFPEWELDFGDNDQLAIPVLSHSQELNNIMLESEDTAVVNTSTTPGTSAIGISGGGPTDNLRIAQTFTNSGTTPLGRLRLYARGGWAASDIPYSIAIYTGSDPASPGTLVASGEGIISAHPDDTSAKEYVDVYFDPFTPVNGQSYIIFIDTEYAKTGGNETYPANFYEGAAVSGGAAYYLNSSSPSWQTLPYDLYFKLYQLGGATTRTFNSQDPAYIAKQIIDFARTRGARVSYTEDSIEATGTLVSVTMKTNTIAEALAAVLKLCPADWYMYYDFGDNVFHLHPRPDTPDHYVTKGRDTVKLRVKKSILGIKNDVYFSGGDTGGGTNLFIRRTDQVKINDWRRGLAKESDNRVTDQTTAVTLADAIIARDGEPIYTGSIRIVRVEDKRIEDFTVGDLLGFIGFGDIVDALEMQNVSLKYEPDAVEIEFNKLSPKVQKRIEDIKRNLEALEQANNPTSPTIT